MALRPFNLRQTPPLASPVLNEPDDLDVDFGDQEVDPATADASIGVQFPDGSILVTIGGQLSAPGEKPSKHGANLAEHLAPGELDGISSDLLRLIEDDEERQAGRLEDIAKGIDLLGVKLEQPRTEPNEAGMSNVKNPLLLEAVVRFQANCRGEFLSADGPVKTRDDGGDTAAEDMQANALAKDMNHYLTSTAQEYYPDTDRMFFSLGFGGEAYKKVYYCPVRRRPVSETVDRKDIILAEGAVSIEVCKRVTHRATMAMSDIKRMQLAGAYRDIDIGPASFADVSTTDEKLSRISGVQPKRILEEDSERIIYECYCELDLPGYEHKEGLKLPYRVTVEKDSKQILEIRRWWKEGDDAYLRKAVFVEYIFVPAFPGVNFGLLHLLGNGGRALTAAWRIALDNGMYANFPGGLIARSAGKQQTTNIRVAPGQVAPIDAENGDVTKAFTPLPYRDVTPNFIQLIEMIEATLQRVGGTAETETGEGRQDAPVGTTLALIEMATKTLNAVHKRMHAAQAREFQMLKELFAEDPESLWRQNEKPNLPQNAQLVTQALNNSNIVPAADPNTASQSLRIQKALMIMQRADMRPDLYDPIAVERRVYREVGISDFEDLFAKGPPQQQQPPVDPAKMLAAPAAMIKAQSSAQDSQTKSQTGVQDSQTKATEAHSNAINAAAEGQNRAADRQAQLQIETMRLKKEQIIHQKDQMLADQHKQDDLDLEHAKLAHQAQQDQLAAAGEGQQTLADQAHERAENEADRQHEKTLASMKPPPASTNKSKKQ